MATKIVVTLKDPDTMHDAVDDTMKREPIPDGIYPDEWDSIREARADRIKSAITHAWMEYGEYLCVEFEIDDNGEAVAAVVKRARG